MDVDKFDPNGLDLDIPQQHYGSELIGGWKGYRRIPCSPLPYPPPLII